MRRRGSTSARGNAIFVGWRNARHGLDTIGTKDTALQLVSDLTNGCEPPPVTIDYPLPTRGRLDRFLFDGDYLARLERGDAEVEQHFASYFGELLLIKLRNRLHDSQSAADLAQETFVRVLHAIRVRKAVRHPERLGSFVNSVCENVLLEFFRVGKATQNLDEEMEEVVDCTSSVESELINAERLQAVRNVLNELSRKDRILLKGIFLEELDRDQLCEELNIDRKTMRVRLHRALTRFRACLGSQLSSGSERLRTGKAAHEGA